nr:MAG TPA: hypothetical protein [Caudoviricetes sp.]
MDKYFILHGKIYPSKMPLSSVNICVSRLEKIFSSL